MAATGRDIVTFVLGLALAGLSPVVLFAEVELLPLLAVAGDVFGGVPLHQVGIVAFLALLGAAWVDTSSPSGDAADWE
jgi:hypothetical protein